MGMTADVFGARYLIGLRKILSFQSIYFENHLSFFALKFQKCRHFSRFIIILRIIRYMGLRVVLRFTIFPRTSSGLISNSTVCGFNLVCG